MDTNTDGSLYFALLRELEPHVQYLLEQKWTIAADIWRAQNDLIKFQVKLQESIAGERSIARSLHAEMVQLARSKAPDWKARCQELQQQVAARGARISERKKALLVSRRLGDAWAWLLFRFNESLIEPLTRNQRIGNTSSGHALLGLLGIAEAMSNAGAGFPVIHDMTDCLRVGDITFVTPGQSPLTVEVKSHTETEEGGAVSLRIETHLVSGPGDADRWREIHLKIPTKQADDGEGAQGTSGMNRLYVRPNSRLSRQLDRMREARAWQGAVPDELVELGNGAVGISVQAHIDRHTHHWDIVQNLATRARSEGYASQSVDGAFVYMAIYSDTALRLLGDPVILPGGDTMAKDVVSSGILFSEPQRNRLVVATSLEFLSDNTPLNVLPFFWYPLPQDMIVDMMCGKLFFAVLINLGRVVEALQKAGLDADLPADEVEYQTAFLPISRQITLEDNSFARIELRGMAYYAPKLSLEFLSLSGFVGLVEAMTQASLVSGTSSASPNGYGYRKSST